MPSSYPSGFDELNSGVGAPTDDLDSPSHSAHHTALADAVEAVQAELGTDPAASYATVADHLDATFLTDGSREIDGDLVVAGATPTYWVVPNSPRTHAATDYYTAGAIGCFYVLRTVAGVWSSHSMADDGTTTLPVSGWDDPDAWDDGFKIHLCDATTVGVPKLTVVSNRPWSEVSAYLDGEFGVGVVTADYPDLGGWTYNGAPTYDWTDSTGLAVCAPSASTTWPDPAVMTGVVGAKLTVDQDGAVTILGDLNIGYGGVTISDVQTFYAADTAATLGSVACTDTSAINDIPTLRIGDGAPGRYLVVDSASDFYPPVTSDTVEPTVAVGAVRIWEDTAGGPDYWLIYGTSGGNVKVQLT